MLATVTELAREEGAELEHQVLHEATASLQEPEYDNWDGGTYYYTLTLTVPVPLFAQLGNRGSELEHKISKRINQLQRGPDNHRITAVVIQPGMAKSRDAARVTMFAEPRRGELLGQVSSAIPTAVLDLRALTSPRHVVHGCDRKGKGAVVEALSAACNSEISQNHDDDCRGFLRSSKRPVKFGSRPGPDEPQTSARARRVHVSRRSSIRLSWRFERVHEGP